MPRAYSQLGVATLRQAPKLQQTLRNGEYVVRDQAGISGSGLSDRVRRPLPRVRSLKAVAQVTEVIQVRTTGFTAVTPTAPYWSPYTYDLISLRGDGRTWGGVENHYPHSELVAYQPAFEGTQASVDYENAGHGFVYFDATAGSWYCWIREPADSGMITYEPFDVLLLGSEVRIWPGTVNSVVPDNVFDTFTYTPGTDRYVYVQINTDGKAISSAVVFFSSTAPSMFPATQNVAPPEFHVPIAVISDGNVFQIWPGGNMTATATVSLIEDIASPTPGQQSTIKWYNWVVAP